MRSCRRWELCEVFAGRDVAEQRGRATDEHGFTRLGVESNHSHIGVMKESMSALQRLDWTEVRQHYDVRLQVCEDLASLRKRAKLTAFVELLLGISNPAGNYSAAEHALGPRVLAANSYAEDNVVKLADQLRRVTNGHQVPKIIREAKLRFLQIGVGSEASCMLNPQVCWVANTRTVWTHLVIKHADDFEKAAVELKLYREADVSSEMAYSQWAAIHHELAATMTRIAEEGEKLSKLKSVRPGDITYIWADAIANQLYNDYYER